MRCVSLTVHGMPAPQGSKRFVGRTSEGRGIMVESSKKVAPWRRDVCDAALKLRDAGIPPFTGPVSVRMVFTLAKPLSAPKTRRSYPMRKPDLSKLARSTEDALVTAGLIADDARIVEYTRLAKVFPNQDEDSLISPGVQIVITELDEIRVGRPFKQPQQTAEDLFP